MGGPGRSGCAIHIPDSPEACRHIAEWPIFSPGGAAVRHHGDGGRFSGTGEAPMPRASGRFVHRSRGRSRHRQSVCGCGADGAGGPGAGVVCGGRQPHRTRAAVVAAKIERYRRFFLRQVKNDRGRDVALWSTPPAAAASRPSRWMYCLAEGCYAPHEGVGSLLLPQSSRWLELCNPRAPGPPPARSGHSVSGLARWYARWPAPARRPVSASGQNTGEGAPCPERHPGGGPWASVEVAGPHRIVVPDGHGALPEGWE